MTADAPANYPFVGPNPAGYYQFTNLAPGTYTVVIDTNQRMLAQLFPSPAFVGTNGLVDSNGQVGTDPGNQNPAVTASVTLPNTDEFGVSSTIDESIDFGFALSQNITVSLSCSTKNTGMVGVAFDSGPLTVTGGVPPYKFSIVGTLPAGLVLNMSTGEVKGTPSAAGSFAVQVTDSQGNSSQACPIDINPAPLMVTCAANNTATVGVHFDSGAPTVTGGVAPYTFSIVGGLANLPAGLSLNTATGDVSGTPTAPGTFAVQVTDSKGNVGKGCIITVNPPVSVVCFGNNMATVGVPFDSGQLSVTGGVKPYTFSIVGGLANLPPGLMLNTSTGEVTGTPSAPGFFSVQVTDSKGNIGTSCPITVNVPLTVTCYAVKMATEGLFFDSGPLTVTGGVPPYTFSIVGGPANLPAGLTLNTANGDVSGVPTATGSFSVQVTDSMGHVSQGCPLTVTLGEVFEISYASNLNAADASINITNSGANGANPNGPGFGAPAGNICVNVYAFAPDEQMISCCSCLVTPNGLVSLSVNKDLLNNTLTGSIPDSIVIKLLTSLAGPGGSGSSCAGSPTSPTPLVPGKIAWRTSVHPAVGGGFATTETPFTPATLSPAELASLTNRCINIIGNGSSFGICASCQSGGLGAAKK